MSAAYPALPRFLDFACGLCGWKGRLYVPDGLPDDDVVDEAAAFVARAHEGCTPSNDTRALPEHTP